jgi:hypothetical protein
MKQFFIHYKVVSLFALHLYSLHNPCQRVLPAKFGVDRGVNSNEDLKTKANACTSQNSILGLMLKF